MAERAKHYLWQLGEDVTALLEQGVLPGKAPVFAESFEALCSRLAKGTLLYLDAFLTGGLPVPPAFLLSLTARQLAGYGIRFETLVEDLTQYQKEGFAVVVLTPSRRKAEALLSMLQEGNLHPALDEHLSALPGPGDLTLAVGGLSAGLDFPDGKFAILSEGEALPPRKPRARKAKVRDSSRQRLESFTDLAPGDLVVHEHHGIGRFVGMVKMTVDGIPRDYIKLQFAGTDTLYVPALQLDLVSKYIGGGEDSSRKRLSKLGGADWERAKSKAKKAARDMAKGLIQLYAQRQRLAGHAFAPDSPWQREFEALFPYPETEDQLRCAQEIKADMEKPVPMDRLLCGDVGYGKTEVAFRAVMKCVLEGKQAAILVPTTVLAQQHYMTALKRFSHFPVEVEMLSRFRTPAQTRDILRRTQEGSVDLLIGTHKLLGKDLHFHDLGLLVVDEEQRFGVGHKEKLKKLAHQVDVLTLSATPIPRTLNMALSGLRDMSTLEQPPTNRQPVQTYVVEHDWGLLADAIRRELDRGGQVYYLHNRTETIDRTAAKLRSLLGEQVRLAAAHGKMDQEQLGDIMSQMADGAIDILVCTTIIETGIDLPNVNTLIIEKRRELRPGPAPPAPGAGGPVHPAGLRLPHLPPQPGAHRGPVQAPVRHPGVRRLRLRVQDRHAGPGDPGGREPAGGRAVGLPHERGLRPLPAPAGGGGAGGAGQARWKRRWCAPPTSPSPPPSRSDTSPPRSSGWTSTAASPGVRTQEEGDDITDELIDRYGDPPAGVTNLVAIALLRSRAAALGIPELAQKESSLRLSLPHPDFAQVAAVCGLEEVQAPPALLRRGEALPGPPPEEGGGRAEAGGHPPHRPGAGRRRRGLTCLLGKVRV